MPSREEVEEAILSTLRPVLGLRTAEIRKRLLKLGFERRIVDRALRSLKRAGKIYVMRGANIACLSERREILELVRNASKRAGRGLSISAAVSLLNECWRDLGPKLASMDSPSVEEMASLVREVLAELEEKGIPTPVMDGEIYMGLASRGVFLPPGRFREILDQIPTVDPSIRVTAGRWGVRYFDLSGD